MHALGSVGEGQWGPESEVGCGDDDNGSERAVEWGFAPPVGPNWIRISAVIAACIYDQPLFEAPIVEHQGDRVYIELRH